ncbi:uncharacterized protein [Nicotiana tomentosiformis]|uniref:uncharacterized protein n=1 Tax=Nicotiana tomentosiformis TaxID=4098 RepID=UPI00388C6565
MANGIGRCLREWGINKIFIVIVDNASSNDVTVKELSKQLTKLGTNLLNSNHLHVRCMAHITNLMVQDGLKESSVSIECVRHAVRYVRQSPVRLKRFQECFDDEQLNYCSLLDTSTSGLSGCQVSTQNTGLLESLMQDLKKYKTVSGGVDTRTELDKYFGEETEDDTKEFDVLLWWKLNSTRFLILAEIARDVLAIPILSVAFKCVFSMRGRLLDSFRSSLTHKLVQALVCLQDWLRNKKLKQPISVEEDT